jgi:hypothetical protein
MELLDSLTQKLKSPLTVYIVQFHQARLNLHDHSQKVFISVFPRILSKTPTKVAELGEYHREVSNVGSQLPQLLSLVSKLESTARTPIVGERMEINARDNMD